MFEYSCTIIRVIDGDTVDVDIDLGFELSYKTRVRLAGIDTPEIRTKDLDEKKRGFAAKQFVEEWFKGCPEGITITTEFDKRGKFGRVLGTFWASTVCLNAELINLGHAKLYQGGKR